MKKVSLIIILLVLGLHLFDQELIQVKGVVYNNEKPGKPLKGVRVLFKNVPGYSGYTDEDGGFAISVLKKDSYNITLLKDGYLQNSYEGVTGNTDGNFQLTLIMKETDCDIQIVIFEEDTEDLIEGVSYLIAGQYKQTPGENPFIIKTSELNQEGTLITFKHEYYYPEMVKFTKDCSNIKYVYLKKKK